MAKGWILGTAAVALLGAQLVPVERTNPGVESEIPAPDSVREILRRSCYDCHSHETRWPWYSRVAPLSWLIRRDVTHAQEHLNFSTWNRYDPDEQREHFEEIAEEIEESAMPLWYYLPLHPEARLSDPDRAALIAWSRTSGG
jgi:hypothetical protein